MSALEELEAALRVANDVERAAAVLHWDLEVCMPRGGVGSRASQLANLGRLGHELATSDRVGRLIEAAEAETQGLDPDSDAAGVVRVARRDYEHAVRIPAGLVADIAEASARARPVWQAAREASDWSLFAPAMRRTVELARHFAEAAGYEADPYDALVDRGEPGMTTAEVGALLAEMGAATAPLVRRIAERDGAVDDGFLTGDFDPQLQLDFSRRLVERLGFDFGSGRQDLSAHPFCTSFGPGDVRLTTRVNRFHLPGCLFGLIHEAGHGMYDQGLPAAIDRGGLWAGASPGVHESQSRLWENLVGRSRGFWRHFFPDLAAAFPQLAGVGAEGFYRAVNRVRPSYIRVEADEVTYNLHILLRFEIERDLLAGRLDVDDVPEAWGSRLDDLLGLPEPTAADGPLQDIHWTHPVLGGFIGYSIGNAISVQLLDAARAELGDLDERLEAGDFGALRGWLGANVYAHGRKFTPPELVLKATGRPLTAAPWAAYVTAKYSELYGL